MCMEIHDGDQKASGSIHQSYGTVTNIKDMKTDFNEAGYRVGGNTCFIGHSLIFFFFVARGSKM